MWMRLASPIWQLHHVSLAPSEARRDGESGSFFATFSPPTCFLRKGLALLTKTCEYVENVGQSLSTLKQSKSVVQRICHLVQRIPDKCNPCKVWFFGTMFPRKIFIDTNLLRCKNVLFVSMKLWILDESRTTALVSSSNDVDVSSPIWHCIMYLRLRLRPVAMVNWILPVQHFPASHLQEKTGEERLRIDQIDPLSSSFQQNLFRCVISSFHLWFIDLEQ